MRITDKILNSFVDSINAKTGNNLATWTKTKNGLKANIGNYHLGYYDKFVTLLQVTSNGGGVTEICSSCTKKRIVLFHARIFGKL